MGCVVGFLACVNKLIGDQSDESTQLLFKKKVLLYAAVVPVFGFGYIFVSNNARFDDLRRLSAAPGLVGNSVLLVQLLYEKKVREQLVEWVLYSDVLSFLLFDWVSVTLYNPQMWSSIVVLLDIALVLRLPSHVTRNIIIASLIWFAVFAVESSFRVGFYDFSFLPSQDERHDLLACTDLPCTRPFLVTGLVIFFGRSAIFILDFYFTRGFSSRLYAEHEKMENVILAAENIAETLSRFDLTKAREALDTSPLPPPLHNAFSNILSNLQVYRPYVPDAVFAELQHAGEHSRDVPAPGLDSGQATLVFTDIQGSTATWEACPEGMREGLKVHNNVMRECLSEHNGYEVKTIGDSFMVAFEKALDAVSFSLSVQEKLVNSIWPQELLLLDHCAWNNDGPWCGLRVRIGVHFGEVDVQLNTLTGRYDYFGNTVNKAARMEGACVGGAVAVTEEVMDQIGEQVASVVIPMGEVRLRGVSHPVYPFILLCGSLSGRAPFVESQLLLSRGDRRLVQPVVHRPSESLSIPQHSIHEMLLMPSSSASVGLLDMRLPDECNAAETSLVVNDTLAKVMMCTERSHGVLISVQGSRVAVGWNTSRPCPTHIENSLSFVVTLNRIFSVETTQPRDSALHIGLSSSEVKHGTVGGKKQKFVTVLGRCVDVAGSLCSLGVKDDVFCLYGSVAEELCAMDGVRFELHAEAAVTGLGLNVYEVSVKA